MRPERAADGVRSRSSDEGGVGTLSSSSGRCLRLRSSDRGCTGRLVSASGRGRFIGAAFFGAAAFGAATLSCGCLRCGGLWRHFHAFLGCWGGLLRRSCALFGLVRGPGRFSGRFGGRPLPGRGRARRAFAGGARLAFGRGGPASRCCTRGASLGTFPGFLRHDGLTPCP